MALKFFILAVAISAVAAEGENNLSESNRKELALRADACAFNIPGRDRDAYWGFPPQEKCVRDELKTFSTKADPQTPDDSLPNCLRSAGTAESYITELTECLQNNLPLPWTFVEGNTSYNRTENTAHFWGHVYCLEESPSWQLIDPLIGMTCDDQLDFQYDYGASEEAVTDWMRTCLKRANATDADDVVECYKEKVQWYLDFEASI
ncbi:Striatin Pro11 [Frankliniella fusca]|uniref:Striatin Pro11 n=1 Tax=Frankliniella fusca TaxID=407009 RepID=A0AAE1LMC0_9NEOP|nr:Striatin Pro11 [Frankliniella fusca]